MINTAIMLTLSRIVITPVIVACLYYQYWLLALILLAIAGVTDMLDGYLARAWQQESFLGACLDPIADKFLLLTLYVSSLVLAMPEIQMPSWFVVLAFVREAIILVGAAYLAVRPVLGQVFDRHASRGLRSFSEVGKHKVAIKPTYLSKVTTVVQLIFMGILFLSAAALYPLGVVGTVLLFVLACLLVVSGLQYIIIGLKAGRIV